VSYKAYEFDSLISHPKEASLRVLSPSVIEIDCITHAFSASTPEEGIDADLVYVLSSPSDLHTQMGSLLEEYKKVGVEGKIAIIWGVASPPVVWAAQQAGALAQVHISGEDVMHEMIVTTVWGTPTPESAARIPRVPAISIKKSDGERLLGLLEKGPVRVSLRTKSETKWRRLPLTVAEIPGPEEPERFMLVHGHMDSWYVGTTDNCTGNALVLELARLLQHYRNKLKRSVRIAWWSGHSTGRYSGSTWYADNLFEDLEKHCFLSMNIDSPGVKEATDVGGGGLMGTTEFIRGALMEAVGSEDVKPGAYYMRAGDQSFYGIGIPSVAQRAYIPEGHPLKGRWIGGGGNAWWWHSAHDTLDKGDKDHLLRDLKMAALAVFRSVNSAVLPFDFSLAADQYQDVVIGIQTRTTSGTFNLNPVLDRVRALKAHSEELNTVTSGLKNADRERLYELNGLLMEISRILTSTFYTYAGKYDQDPAYGIPSLPSLQGAKKLAELDPESDEARFLQTKMVREINKVNHQLDGALRKIGEAIKVIKG
ncbi:MAG: Zn-dependent exopeptidase M28, partial [Deltaproteobacteria bacterium]